MATKKKIKKKRYRLKPRFFSILFAISIIINITFFFLRARGDETMPNLHGWSSDDVLVFEEEHDNISIIFELVYSNDVIPTRVVSQSIQPGTNIADTNIVMTVEVSKGVFLE